VFGGVSVPTFVPPCQLACNQALAVNNATVQAVVLFISGVWAGLILLVGRLYL
jgi:hypothetical protein